MEERIVKQVRIYKLILNPMVCAYEAGEIVALSGDYNRLVSWYEEQKLYEPYRDDSGWYRTFAKESPLHWFNPADNLELNCTDHFGHGISDEWVNEDVWYNICESERFYIVEEE